MTIRDICLSTLEICERHFRLIEAAVPPPQWVEWENSYNWRFVERAPTQMLLQKLARQITGLKSADLLLQAGLLQEVGAAFRTLDEISEDILYISLGLSKGNWTENHDKYADYFWSESEDDHQPPVRRKNIRAFINRVYDIPNPSGADQAGRTLHKAFSDYIHARSAPIMSMVVGPPARFDLNGITNTIARNPYAQQIPSYFYRALLSTSFIARVALADEANAACYNAVIDFEREHGHLVLPA